MDEPKVLEELYGFVDKIDGDIAYITILSSDGSTEFEGEYSAEVLKKQGIKERRRFKIRTIDDGKGVQVQFEKAPFLEIKPEDMRRINEMVALLDNDPD